MLQTFVVLSEFSDSVILYKVVQPEIPSVRLTSPVFHFIICHFQCRM